MTRRTRSAAWMTAAPLAVLVAAVALPAAAHMPFLLPNYFSVTDRDHVTVDAGFTETAFASDIALKSEQFHMLAPDGSRVRLAPVFSVRDKTVLEAALPTRGTYRLSTGLRLGRLGRMARVKDAWVVLGEGNASPPAGATSVVPVQSVTTSETYVTRGAPTATVLAPTGSGVELHPLTHPSELFVTDGFAFELLHDGKPLANQRLELFLGHQVPGSHRPLTSVTTDAAGKARLDFSQPGLFMLMTRHRGPAPAGAATPWRSHTYTLTFEVMP